MKEDWDNKDSWDVKLLWNGGLREFQLGLQSVRALKDGRNKLSKRIRCTVGEQIMNIIIFYPHFQLSTRIDSEIYNFIGICNNTTRM